MKVCLISFNLIFPATRSLLQLLKSIKQVEVHYINYVDYSSRSFPLDKPLGFLFSEFFMFFKILFYSKKFKNCIFVIFDAYLPLTLIAIRLLRRKSILVIGSSLLKEKIVKGHRIFAWLGHFTQIFAYYLSDNLVIFGEYMTDWVYANKFSSKIRIAPQPIIYALINNFYLEKPYRNRKAIIGYVGALTEHKGFHLLIESIKYIKTGMKDNYPKFLIIGSGSLEEELRKRKDLYDNVNYIGFIPHNKLRRYYNEMKLLVLPSYTEGMPAVIFEAMACGTPVLATPVGAIPNIIKDCETGFLLKSNDPSYIAERIVELLSKHDLLEKVSINAYKYIRTNFSDEKILEAWRKILIKIEL